MKILYLFLKILLALVKVGENGETLYTLIGFTIFEDLEQKREWTELIFHQDEEL